MLFKKRDRLPQELPGSESASRQEDAIGTSEKVPVTREHTLRSIPSGTTSVNPLEIFAAAQRYTDELGWPILPLVPGQKTPLTTNGLKDASTDQAMVRQWWSEHPTANIGVRTGAASGLVVIDVDVKNDAGGMESLATLEAEHGEFVTLQATSASGGRHLFFAAPECSVRNAVCLWPGIDVRGDGGYIVVAPSCSGGGRYHWDNEMDPAPLPDWLLTKLTERPLRRVPGQDVRQTQSVGFSGLAGTAQGGRNDLVFRLACKLRQDGFGYDDAMPLVLQAAANCSPPLPEEEAMRCLTNAWGYDPPVYLSELGNAERLVARHDGNIRYVVDEKYWLVWGGLHWRQDTGELIHRLAKDTVRSIRDEAHAEEDDNARKAILSHATRSEAKSKIDAMLALAAREEGIPIGKADLDPDDLLFGVQNGVVDLRTGDFRAARPDDLVTKVSQAECDPSAECPDWQDFMYTIFMGSAEMVDYMQRVVGYILTGMATERALFVFFGDGANGKTTVIEVLRALLGGYALQALPETFMAKRWGKTVNNDVARMAGARFVSASESDEGDRLAEGLVKSLTGGDTVTARFLFQEYAEFRSRFKLVLVTNKLPEVRGSDPAIWDRLHLVQFPYRIPESQRDPNLRARLLAELPGILNWAVAGSLQWQSAGLRPPEQVTAATRSYREHQDLLDLWLAERCTLGEGMRAWSKDLYSDYRGWLEVQGEEPVTHRVFGERMGTKGFARRKSSNYYYDGLSLI